MQEQSKKAKRLEKENEALKRQKEATAANIIRMAEERQDLKIKMDAADKKTEKLMSIIQQMQHQGRKVPSEMASAVKGHGIHAESAGPGEDSDYSDDAEEEGEGSDQDDTEEELPPSRPQPPQPGPATNKVPYGPERPPIPPGSAAINGH